jgi:hypothetical protein
LEKAVEAVQHGEHNEAVTRGRPRRRHATEVALDILRPGYVPKREALGDVRAMLAWLDDDDPTWLRTD